MLQAINAMAQLNLTDASGQALPAGFAQAQGAAGAAHAFDQQMAVQAFSAATPALSPAEETPAAPSALSEADAGQWLAAVLDQQAARIEAREAQQPAQQESVQEEGIDVPEQPMAVPGQVVTQVLMPQQPQPREPLPAAPANGSSAPVPAALAMPSQTVAPMPQRAAEGVIQAAAPAMTTEVIEAAGLERLPNPAADTDNTAPGPTTAATANTAPLAAERPLKLHAPQAQWGEQMLASLREQVDVQINQRIQNATIRLDPPELGSLEIFLSHESGRLSVQLSAANADVARLLQQTSERLRQELVGQNFVQVNVQVSADAQGGRQQGQPRQAWQGEEMVQAASLITPTSERGKPNSTSDVLVTV